MPEMSQLFMDDAITYVQPQFPDCSERALRCRGCSADEMCDNINDYATTFTYMIFDYADTDNNKVSRVGPWISKWISATLSSIDQSQFWPTLGRCFFTLSRTTAS